MSLPDAAMLYLLAAIAGLVIMFWWITR